MHKFHMIVQAGADHRLGIGAVVAVFRRAVGQAGQGAGHRQVDDGVEQRFLVLESVMHRPGGTARRLGDVADGGIVEALFLAHPAGIHDQRVAQFAAARLFYGMRPAGAGQGLCWHGLRDFQSQQGLTWGVLPA